jgi:hypothetical protein
MGMAIQRREKTAIKPLPRARGNLDSSWKKQPGTMKEHPEDQRPALPCRIGHGPQ